MNRSAASGDYRVVSSIVLGLALMVSPPAEVDRPPHTGSGRIVGSSIGLGLSTGLVVSGGLAWTYSRPDRRFDNAMTFSVLGGIGLAASSSLLASGLIGRRKYRAWEARRGPGLRSGYGMFVGGLMLTAGGGIVALTGATTFLTLSFAHIPDPDPNIWVMPTSLLVSGVVTAGVGLPVMILGKRRMDVFDKWRIEFDAPTPMVQRGGFGLGISGRF